VRPVVLATQLLQIVLEEGAHRDDTVGHLLHLTEPLRVQLGIVQDLGCNPSSIDGRVGVKRADKNLDLRVDTLGFLGRFSENGESANTFTIETLRGE
jgi:hypothetical protein